MHARGDFKTQSYSLGFPGPTESLEHLEMLRTSKVGCEKMKFYISEGREDDIPFFFSKYNHKGRHIARQMIWCLVRRFN